MMGSASFFRRLGVMVIAALVLLAAGPGAAPAAAAGKTTLVLGVDISDTRTFDPARQFEYSAPITMKAAYETLVTVSPATTRRSSRSSPRAGSSSRAARRGSSSFARA